MHFSRLFVILQPMMQISILIPTYNGVCTSLVGDLQGQASALGIDYELLVADDGSTDVSTIASNRAINLLPHCRYIERQENVGRAAIRNFLASQSRYPWLLFIDSDMTVCRPDFIQKYVQHVEHDAQSQAIFYGGIIVSTLQPGNLRSMYEKASEPHHTPERRQQSPYHDFHTANFLVPRDVMLTHPFDSRFQHYGYEDVLFGKQMQQSGIDIIHIDNPLSFEIFESNMDFVSKTEEGLRTLHQFRDELEGYSRLLKILPSPQKQKSGIWLVQPSWVIAKALRLWHRIFGKLERRNLTGQHPRLLLFTLYKLGYLASLER